MTTRNSVGFCNRCNQQVLLSRKEIDVCLAIILLIFTVGIGLLIYLAIYYSKPEDRCIHCGTQITRYPAQNQFIESRTQYQTIQNTLSPEEPEKIPEDIPKFCALCGDKISHMDRFCSNCGGKI